MRNEESQCKEDDAVEGNETNREKRVSSKRVLQDNHERKT